MEETKTEELLAAVLKDFARLRSTARLNRRDVLQVIDQAEACIIDLLTDCTEAEGVADMMSDETEHFAKMNKQLAGMLGSIHTGGRSGTA